MKKYYIVINLSGHCGAQAYNGFEILTKKEMKKKEKRFEDWHKRCLEEGRVCSFCKMSEAEQWGRFSVVEISASSKEEAEIKFWESLEESWGEIPSLDDFLRQIYTY